MNDHAARTSLTAWLARRNITVESLRRPDERAFLLGEVTAAAAVDTECRSLLARLARRMRERSPYPVHVSRKGVSDRQAEQVRELAQQLASLGIVARLHWSEGAVVTVYPLTSDAVNRHRFNELAGLLGGEWLENYALDAVRRLGAADVSVGHRVSVRLPAGCLVGLDVFAVVAGRPLWIECKTGRNYQERLARYGTLAGLLGTGRARSILTVCGVAPEHARAVGLVHGLTVTAPSDLASALARAAAA